MNNCVYGYLRIVNRDLENLNAMEIQKNSSRERERERYAPLSKQVTSTLTLHRDRSSYNLKMQRCTR